jgi:hypothetical protein
MIRNAISEKVALVISGHKTRSVFDRYNITNYADLVDAGRKIRKVESESSNRRKSLAESSHRTAIVNNENKVRIENDSGV